MDASSPIGFFDSGLGGISVLKHAVKLLPHEDFVYYGDSLNAPYGSKSRDDIYALAVSAINKLLERDIKALVIACNTASSVLGNAIRDQYKNLIIVEIEPALKPAVLAHKKGTIVVMATEATLAGEKFKNMVKMYKEEAQIFPLACKGLVEFIESGDLNSPLLRNFLEEKFHSLPSGKIDAVVLGCTHYPFIKPVLRDILDKNIIFYDGGEGTARQLKNLLANNALLKDIPKKGDIFFLNSEKNEHSLKISKLLFEHEF